MPCLHRLFALFWVIFIFCFVLSWEAKADTARARAAYDYLHEKLDVECLSKAYCPIQGEFFALDNNICEIGALYKKSLNLFNAEVFRYRLSMKNIDLGSTRTRTSSNENVKDVYLESARGSFFIIEMLVPGNNGFVSQGNVNEPHMVLMIGDGDEERIMKALRVLATECGAPDAPF